MSLQVTKASQTSQTMNRPQFHNSAFEGTMFKRPQAPRKAITAASVPVQTAVPVLVSLTSLSWNLRSDDAETKIVRFPYMFWHIHILSPTEWR